ncbi:IS3 family transposase [Oceanidesulfovibrio marinus]|uniref:IS3 family transposase n=1 Tax=Oceanidesulfovibrio marinus TaxID=370038 RepID=A0ABX6NIB8_9BACT|nr:IS3 family transposase [Oceanidesulfovibrio marinus]QJT10398.1 IS3 family transposase [Oceanidesulfovibrio marinus]
MSRHSANEYPTVEVVHSVQRRRWALTEKLRIVEESSQPGMSVSYVARKHGIAPNLLFRWRKLMSEGGRKAIEANDTVVSAAEARAMKKRIRDLERLLGKKTMEVEILKEAIEIAREKKTDLAHAIALRGRYPMTRVADAMGVSRSRLVERVGAQPKVRPPRYSKAEDEALLPLIRDIIDDRLTYGYRRVCAVLNRRLVELGQPRVNHKRVYRIMRLHGLLLTRHSGKRPTRAHDGKVITLRSNLRWSSDVFEVSCANGEAVRVAFAIDCCDREVIGHMASSRGISSSMIQDLMLECVEKRFGTNRTPRPVQWLSDNGSCYTAKDTVEFASWLGLESRFTPVRSPESNGIAEAFVNTFKRDYVRISDRPDAVTVFGQLADWIEDYNERHPHKGLRMKSPREFIRSMATAECPI